MLGYLGRNGAKRIDAFGNDYLFPFRGIESSGRNALDGQSPESQSPHELAGFKGAFGNFGRLVENQGDLVLQHGRGEFMEYAMLH